MVDPWADDGGEEFQAIEGEPAPQLLSGRASLHALPDEDHPPMPCSQASLMHSLVGQRCVRRFMLMPSAALRRKRSHRLRSSASPQSRTVGGRGGGPSRADPEGG